MLQTSVHDKNTALAISRTHRGGRDAVPESVGHLQGDSVLQLPVEATALALKQGVQRAAESQLHHQHLRRRAGRQQADQAGVTEAPQHRQLLGQTGGRQEVSC